jgi:serine/threonine protein kinase
VHNEHGELLAVKRLDPSKTTSEKLKRFENELRFCKNEAHPNIVKVPDEGFTNEGGKKAPFYVMPFYPKTLRHLMRKGIPPERILPCFAQVLDGIKAAHLQGVWHRDLKPENILYDPGTDTLVVADFGIAHFEEEGIYTAVDTNDSRRLANFLYAAPEQRTRGNEVDHRADIYALGLILNEMFTHQILQGEGYKRIESVAPQFKYLDEGVSLMVQQEPKKRPASVDAIKELLLARGDEYVSE